MFNAKKDDTEAESWTRAEKNHEVVTRALPGNWKWWWKIFSTLYEVIWLLHSFSVKKFLANTTEWANCEFRKRTFGKQKIVYHACLRVLPDTWYVYVLVIVCFTLTPHYLQKIWLDHSISACSIYIPACNSFQNVIALSRRFWYFEDTICVPMCTSVTGFFQLAIV